MGLIRRKLERKKAPDDSSGAQASPGRGEDAGSVGPQISPPSEEQAPAAEQAAPSQSGEEQTASAGAPPALRRELFRGSIVAPAEGTVVGGPVEIEASLAEGASNTGARLDWSLDGTEWNTVEIPADDYELLAARAGASSSRIALVRSIELAEAKKLSLEQEGYERVELSPARPSSWQGRQRFLVGFDTTHLPEGSCFLRLVAISAEGEEVASDPVKIEIANASAAAELVDPGELLHGQVNLIARTPDLRSTQMIFEIAVAGSNDWRALGTTRAPFHLSVDTRQLVDGSYELRIESVTTEGQSVHSKRFGPYTIDNTPPAITIAQPAKGETLHGWVELVVEVTDDASGPARVELSYSEEDEWKTLAELEPKEGEVRGFWQTGECRPGSCRLRATAFDRAGNEASEVIEVTIVAPVASGLEHASERESILPSPAQNEPKSVHRLSPEVAGRFGQIPSWDWQHLRPAGSEPSSGVESTSAEPDDALEPSPEPELLAGAEAEPVSAAAPREQGKKSVAWTWKTPSPRSEPEEEPANRPEAGKELPSEPGREAEETLESEQEGEPEEQVGLAEKEPVQDICLVGPVRDEEQEEAEQESEDKPKESGAEEGGRVVKVNFARAARGWDIWELSELVEETPGQDPAREEERRQILYHLREHTAVDGRIPPEFEDLVFEVFGDLIRDEPGR
jgi:hypothetical protein